MARAPSHRSQAAPAKAVASAATKKMGFPAPIGGALAPLSPKADFTSGSDGRVRQTWGRYLGNGPMGFSPMGWNAWGGMTYPLVGGKPARESLKAAAVISDLITANPTLSTIVETIIAHAVGTGLTLSAKPDARALGISDAAARSIADQLERRFSDWANDPYSVDKSGRFTLTDYAQLVMRTYVMTGECFVAFDWQSRQRASTKTCLQVLDNLQIALDVTMQLDGERHTFQGIVFNRDGRFLGVMARRMPIGSFVQTSPQPEFIPAFTSWGRTRIAHLFAPVDARQCRGLSPLVAALSAMLERESLSEFEVVAALLQTQFGISLESQLPAAQAAGALSVSDELSTVGPDFLGLKEKWYETNKVRLEPGQIAMLAPGDKIAFHRNEHPNRTFADFDKSLANRAARASGVEATDISANYGDITYSSARIAQETPFRLNLMRRKAIVERFYQVTFENLVEEWIESGQIELPAGAPPFQDNRRAYTAASWFGFGRIQPDPYRQMKTDVEGLQAGVVTLSEVLAERGVDFERHVEALAHEVKIMEEMGLQHPFTVAVEAAEGEPDDDERMPEGEAPIAPAKEPAAQPARRRKVKAFAVEHGTDTRGMSTVEYVSPEKVRAIYEAEDEHLDADTVLGL